MPDRVVEQLQLPSLHLAVAFAHPPPVVPGGIDPVQEEPEGGVGVGAGDGAVGLQSGWTPPPLISVKTLSWAAAWLHPLTLNRRYCASQTLAPSLSTYDSD